MDIMTVVANPNPKSFSHAILERFDAGLKDAGHTNDIVDLICDRVRSRVQDPGLRQLHS